MPLSDIVYVNTALDETFKRLFKAYFAEFGMSISDEAFLHMDKDVKKFDIQIVIIYLDQEPVGFSMFQIDTKDNPWCMHDGAGDIREFFVLPSHRRKGYGTMLFETAKSYFKSKHIDEIYLTSDDKGEFWKTLGFVQTGKIIAENNSEEYFYNMSKER
jgi:GNAT superfamily N-acetyltransferase